MSNECIPKRSEYILPVSPVLSNLQGHVPPSNIVGEMVTNPLGNRRATMIVDRIRSESTKSARIGLECLYWVGSLLTGFGFLFLDWAGREIQQLINDQMVMRGKEGKHAFNTKDGASVHSVPLSVENALNQLNKPEKDVFIRIREAQTTEAKGKLAAEFKKELGAVVDDELVQRICDVYEKPEVENIRTTFEAFYDSLGCMTFDDRERAVAKALFVLEQLEIPLSDQGEEQWYKRRIYDFYEFLCGKYILLYESRVAIYLSFQKKHHEGQFLREELYISRIIPYLVKVKKVSEGEAARSIINQRIGFYERCDAKYMVDALEELLTSYEKKAKAASPEDTLKKQEEVALRITP